MTSQVDDCGHRIQRDPAGKMRESHWILQENTENRWNMEAVFRPEIVGIFSGAFWQEPAGNRQKKSENFPSGILFPQNHRNYPEPTVSGPGCSTWVSQVNLEN